MAITGGPNVMLATVVVPLELPATWTEPRLGSRRPRRACGTVPSKDRRRDVVGEIGLDEYCILAEQSDSCTQQQRSPNAFRGHATAPKTVLKVIEGAQPPTNQPSPRKARWVMRLLLPPVIAFVMPIAAHCDDLRYRSLPYPEVNPDTWVLIEMWPTVGDITLSAYFMDFSAQKNQNLCEATKRALDRDAEALAKEQKRETTSFRRCLTVNDAVTAGYVAPSI